MREWLKNLRLSKGLTQNKIAKMVGVDVTTINKIELGKRRPSPETAKAIAAVLEFDWTLFYENCSRNQQGEESR